jgi:hypothetical protein
MRDGHTNNTRLIKPQNLSNLTRTLSNPHPRRRLHNGLKYPMHTLGTTHRVVIQCYSGPPIILTRTRR